LPNRKSSSHDAIKCNCRNCNRGSRLLLALASADSSRCWDNGSHEVKRRHLKQLVIQPQWHWRFYSDAAEKLYVAHYPLDMHVLHAEVF
jgi:hypothetical protein